MRRITLRFPPRIKALNKVKTTYYIKSKHGKNLKRVSFACAECGKTGLKSTEKEMDHKIPVGEFSDWNSYCEQLFCDELNWQVLCLPCHDKKTNGENKKRFAKLK